MKKLVVFYSLEGNTSLVAGMIAETVSADVLEITPMLTPSSKGMYRFIWGGKSAMMKELPEIGSFEIIPEEYDLIFLGSPVWAWTFAPPMRSFLKKHNLSGKKIALFMCHGGGPGKALKKLQEAVSGTVLGEILLRDPLKRDTAAQLKKAGEWASKMAESAQILS